MPDKYRFKIERIYDTCLTYSEVCLAFGSLSGTWGVLVRTHVLGLGLDKKDYLTMMPLVSLPGSCTASSTGSTLTAPYPGMTLSAWLTTPSTPSSLRPGLASTCPGQCLWTWSPRSSMRSDIMTSVNTIINNVFGENYTIDTRIEYSIMCKIRSLMLCLICS